jgi:multidrug efflux pump
MTSFAFILGVVPLLLAHGAGAEMRRALGTAVFSGMIGVTLFGLALTPVFFYSIDWISQTQLFSLPLLRRASGLVLGLLSLRPLRQVAWRVSQRVAAAARGPARSSRPRPLPKPVLPPNPPHAAKPELRDSGASASHLSARKH